MLRSVIFLLATCFCLTSQADFKVDTLFGYYTLEAKTNNGSGNVSALGIYNFNVRKSLMPQFDFGIGYTLQMSKSFYGDVSYGPDLGFFYFPVSNATPIIAKNDSAQVQVAETFRPYVGINFHQRNYQSAKSSYAGFSMIAGCEFDLGYPFYINSQLRYLNLNGPENSTAKDTNLLIGLTFWL